MKRKSFGTNEIAEICQVTPSTIWRWIKKGLLPYFTTAGKHSKVWDTELWKFLKERNIPVPDRLKYLTTRQVLIVDDEDNARILIKQVLQKCLPEIEIYEAADGFEAGKKAAQLLPVLVILDLELRGMDGLEVCKMIRSDKHFKDTQILAVSGFNVEESKKQSLIAGADDFLGKPFNVNELKGKIEKLLY